MRPNFLIIGAARSGTTSLYHNLASHPQIFMPDMKEPQFFTSNWSKGFAWYDGLFDGWSGEPAVGEASMTYTYPEYAALAPERIAAALPGARLIYILREPAQQTFSHYQYYRYYSHTEQADFETALEQREIYLGTSLYAQWLQRYLVHFERDNILVLLFEEYVADPLSVLQQVFRFLEVDAAFVPPATAVKTNASFKPRSRALQEAYLRLSRSALRRRAEALVPQAARPRLRNQLRAVLGSSTNMPQMAPETRARLQLYFEPEVRALEAFLERDLEAWWG